MKYVFLLLFLFFIYTGLNFITIPPKDIGNSFIQLLVHDNYLDSHFLLSEETRESFTLDDIKVLGDKFYGYDILEVRIEETMRTKINSYLEGEIEARTSSDKIILIPIEMDLEKKMFKWRITSFDIGLRNSVEKYLELYLFQ